MNDKSKSESKKIKAGEVVLVNGKPHVFEVKDLLAATVAVDKCKDSPESKLRIALVHLHEVVRKYRQDHK